MAGHSDNSQQDRNQRHSPSLEEPPRAILPGSHGSKAAATAHLRVYTRLHTGKQPGKQFYCQQASSSFRFDAHGLCRRGFRDAVFRIVSSALVLHFPEILRQRGSGLVSRTARNQSSKIALRQRPPLSNNSNALRAIESQTPSNSVNKFPLSCLTGTDSFVVCGAVADRAAKEMLPLWAADGSKGRSYLRYPLSETVKRRRPRAQSNAT